MKVEPAARVVATVSSPEKFITLSLPDVPRREPLGPWRAAALAAALAWAAAVLILAAPAGRRPAHVDETERPGVTGGRSLRAPVRRLPAAPGSLTTDDAGGSPGPGVTGCARGPMARGTRPTRLGRLALAHRRACLLHELAHLARRDDWAKLVQELDPRSRSSSTRWCTGCLARLDRERELLCDEAVVALGADPSSIRHALLLDLARRPGRLLPLAAFRPGWLPFLDRRTVAVRIERLLEDDMKLSLSLPPVRRCVPSARRPGVGRRRWPSAGSASARSPANLRPAEGRPTSRAPQREPVPAVGSARFEGVVLDPDGHPVAGAVVVAGSEDTGRPNHQVFTTDRRGPVHLADSRPARIGFASSPIKRAWRRRSGRVGCPASNAVTMSSAGSTSPSRSRPVWSTKPAGRSPERGSGSRCSAIAAHPEDGVGNSIDHHDLLPGPARGHHRQPASRDSSSATTDRDGSFTFPRPRAGPWLKLGVTAAGGRELRVRAEKAAHGLIPTMLAGSGIRHAPRLATRHRLVALPAARVAGRVITKLPGVRRSVA